LTHKAALELGFAVGCRVSEALELWVEDVDSEKGWVRVPDVKKEDRRIVPIAPEVQVILKMYIRERGLKPARPVVQGLQRDRQHEFR
jgi:site-specific recombinase XerD